MEGHAAAQKFGPGTAQDQGDKRQMQIDLEDVCSERIAGVRICLP